MVASGRWRHQCGIALVQAGRKATHIAQSIGEALHFGVMMVQLEGIGGRICAAVQQIAIRAARLAGTGVARMMQTFYKDRNNILKLWID